MLKFTVFTPIYNRKHTIHRVWESLNEQTFRNFDWVIVDNESEDNVLPLLYEYKEKADFDVTVISHKNRGLHFSLNKGFELARGELYVRLDSDDRMVPEALERFNYWWDYVKTNYDYTRFSGINVLCKSTEGKILGTKYPKDIGVSNTLELKYKIKTKGEKWGCVRADLLKTKRFPENKETYGVYFPDSYIWYDLAKKYNFLYVNEPLRVYYVDGEDQITKQTSKRVLKEVEGKYFFLLYQFNENLDYIFKHDKKSFFELGLNYWRITLKTKRTILQALRDIKSFRKKITAIFFLLPSIVLFTIFQKKFYPSD